MKMFYEGQMDKRQIIHVLRGKELINLTDKGGFWKYLQLMKSADNKTFSPQPKTVLILTLGNDSDGQI